MINKSLNILFITHGYHPCSRLGGPIESVRLLAETLVKLGHKVTVLCTNSNLDVFHAASSDISYEDICGVTVYRFPLLFKPRQSLGFMLCTGIIKFLVRNGCNFDIYHVHVPFIHPTLIASLFSFLYKKPLIYHQRGQLDPVRLAFKKFKKKLYITFVEMFIMRFSCALIALTSKEASDYLLIQADFKSKIHIVPNPVSLPTRHCHSIPVIDTSNNQRLKLYFMGRIHSLKGIPLLFEALTILPEFLMDRMTLTIAGPDEQNLIPYFYNKYPMLVRDNINYVGHLESDDKWNLCLDSDAFILPSWSEGLSMSMLEALCSGNLLLMSELCPFVDSHAGPLDFVQYFSLDPLSISKAICDAINLPRDLLESKKLHASRFAKQKYHPKIVASELISIYNLSLS